MTRGVDSTEPQRSRPDTLFFLQAKCLILAPRSRSSRAPHRKKPHGSKGKSREDRCGRASEVRRGEGEQLGHRVRSSSLLISRSLPSRNGAWPFFFACLEKRSLEASEGARRRSQECNPAARAQSASPAQVGISSEKVQPGSLWRSLRCSVGGGFQCLERGRTCTC